LLSPVEKGGQVEKLNIKIEGLKEGGLKKGALFI
jgi:hypothetical protein